MQRMRRTQKQKCLYGRTMETRRRGTHLPRVRRNTPRCRGAVSMPRLPVLVPRRRISNTIPSSPMQFLSRVPHLRTTQAVRPMQRKKCATEYTSSAWKARNADRRICRACATKSRGSWACRTCRQVLPHQSFTAFRRRRPSGQDGTQVCDKCLQATVIKPIAAMAALRLSRSRQRERNKKIWNEVRREIAAMVSARTRAGEAYPEPAPKRPRCEAGRDNEPFSEAEPGRPPTPAGPKSVYTCPYCETAVQSTVQNGTVFTRNHCGKQFRVKDGQVIRSYQHACPHCGATVVSTKAKGRIQVQHTMPNGQPCKTTQWKASGENMPGHAT